MAVVFNADEVLQIAEELEDTGRVFYESLAVACRDAVLADMCHRLAAEESTHLVKFGRIRASLAGAAERPPLGPEDADFVQGLLNGRVIPDPEEARRIAATGRPVDLLGMAIEMEIDSVRLYERIVTVVADEDASVVEGIIAEEREHERTLRSALKGLG